MIVYFQNIIMFSIKVLPQYTKSCQINVVKNQIKLIITPKYRTELKR